MTATVDEYEAKERAWFDAPAAALFKAYMREMSPGGTTTWDDLHPESQEAWRSLWRAGQQAAVDRGERPTS